MELSILLSTFLTIFATTTPNLCDDVYLDSTGNPYTDSCGQTLSRYCQWTGPAAPVWDADVCCTIDDDGARCSPTDATQRCRTGLKMYCEYGEAVPGGGVICFQAFPSMCDAGFCIAPPDVPPPGEAAHVACCGAGGACEPTTVEDMYNCQGTFVACDNGVTNADGTIDCWA
jgi:hypothetical protein